jgi:hypothetical protein
VVLLWISPRWRLSDKLLGTLIWPGGIAGVLFVLGAAAASGGGASPGACSGGPAPVQSGAPAHSGAPVHSATQHCANSPGTVPGWLGITLIVVVVVVGVGGPVLVARRLVRQARRAHLSYAATASTPS